MIKLSSKSILILTTGCLLNGCSQGPLPLEVTLHQDYVCAFTNNPKKRIIHLIKNLLFSWRKWTTKTDLKVLMRKNI